ncbi:Non-specific lipid-transfer protein 1 [Spatholobus suberectus]|nr:Non-specific lipid-transfer protein 1 [Spatholobus suberectus]
MALLLPVMIFSLLVATFSASQNDDIPCTEGLPMFIICLPYFQGSEAGDTCSLCCVGAELTFHLANTTQLRRSLCECFKKVAAKEGFIPEKEKSLPQLCKISPPFPMDPKDSMRLLEGSIT